MRYLKQGYNGSAARYSNLHQVFIASRIYGGYAQNPSDTNASGCVSPEPFSYEEAFAVQRLTVAQIRQDANLQSNDPYSLLVNYKSDGSGNAPWFDWGPYLWASGETPRQFDQLNWCNGQGDHNCSSNQKAVRYGDPGDQVNYWGDFTHPTYQAAKKVADKIKDFLTNTNNANHAWVAHWIGQ
jgi:hypothetical protein